MMYVTVLDMKVDCGLWNALYTVLNSVASIFGRPQAPHVLYVYNV